MIRGIYTAACGMLVQEARQEVTANNLANVNSSGYKRDHLTSRSFPEMFIHRVERSEPGFFSRPVPVGPLGTGSVIDEVKTDLSPGRLDETGSDLDLLLAGDGYFTLRHPSGDLFYSRSGRLSLDADGLLRGAGGLPVLGRQGNRLVEIYLPSGSLQVNPDGTMTDAETRNGQPVAELALFRFPDEGSLIKTGSCLFAYEGVEQVLPAEVQVRQGFYEKSNSDPVQEMVEMIKVLRAYEANQKVLQAHDSALEKAVNEVGRL